MQWRGTVGELVTGLTVAMQEANPLRNGFWQPALLVRAIIDAPLATRDRPHLVHDASLVALSMYAGASAGERLDRLGHELTSLDLTNRTVTQNQDDQTFFATYTGLSWDAAEDLAARVDDPILMVMLCHGGLVAGIQTLLYHHTLTKTDTTFYPVRFSRKKHRDSAPRLNSREAAELETEADGRTVVIWDEDAGTGRTIGEMKRYLRVARGVSGPILGMVSKDDRTTEDENAQGTYWQLVSP